MTALSITHARDVISKDVVVGIMERCPSLKTLTLSPCIDLQSAFVVPTYCPWLQNLRMVVYSEEREAELSYTDQVQQPCGMQGITSLSIRSYLWFIFNQHEIAAVLKQYSSTLTGIEWDIKLDNDNETDITSTYYPCLTSLVVGAYGWWIPQTAPMLEELKIRSDTICANHAVLDTIPPKMKKLRLDLDHGNRLDDISPVILYLDRLSHHTHLKKLAIRFPATDRMDHIFHVICRLSQLERLTIFDTKWEYSEILLDQLVKGCPRLTYLDIRLGKPPSTHDIHTLKRLQHLQHFNFPVDGTKKDLDDFWAAFHTFPQLKCIRIRPVYPLSKVNQDAISYLLMQRQDMKVIIDRLLGGLL